MKRINRSTATLAVIIVLFTLTAYNTGSPGGKTNAPNEGSCGETGCHQVSAAEREMIFTDIPETGYIPGDTYDITVFIEEEGVNKYGFELACYSQGGTRLKGIVGNDSVTSFALSSRATHKINQFNGNGKKGWTFQWIAPESGYHQVTFYTSVIAANGNNTNAGDALFKDALISPENGTSALADLVQPEITAYPNPFTNYLRFTGISHMDKVCLYSISGEPVYSGSAMEQLDISALAPGYYFAQITGTTGKVIPVVKR